MLSVRLATKHSSKKPNKRIRIRFINPPRQTSFANPLYCCKEGLACLNCSGHFINFAYFNPKNHTCAEKEALFIKVLFAVGFKRQSPLYAAAERGWG
jgi:hypothetical protein